MGFFFRLAGFRFHSEGCFNILSRQWDKCWRTVRSLSAISLIVVIFSSFI